MNIIKTKLVSRFKSLLSATLLFIIAFVIHFITFSQCPTDQTFTKVDWTLAPNSPFVAFTPTSFTCTDGVQKIWKNVESNINTNGNIQTSPGFNANFTGLSSARTSILVSVNGVPYSYYGNNPPANVINWGAVIPNFDMIEPYLPSGSTVTLEICDTRAAVQTIPYTIYDHFAGTSITSGTVSVSNGGGCKTVTFTVGSPTMTWNIDGNAADIINNNDGSASFDPSALSVGSHVINYSYTNGSLCSLTATQNITITCPVPPVPACPTDQSFIKLDWAQSNPFPAFSPTSFSCNDGPQKIWKNIEAANIDKKGELEAFPGFIMEVTTNAASNVNTSVLVSVNGTPYSYYGPGPAPVGVLDFGPMTVPPSKQLILEPFLPAGANVTIQICDARGVAQSFAYTVNDYSTGVVLKSGTATPSAGNCTSMNFTLSSPVMTWNIDNNASFITNNNDGSGTFNPSTLSVGPHTINYSWNNGAGCTITATQNITINPLTIPTFTSISPICTGGAFTLPTSSTNFPAITGLWSPAIDNTQTKTYTFTPTAGQCASTTTLTVTVNQPVVPTFTAVTPICSGANLNALPTISNNNIVGSWSPALDNTQTKTYTFTPTAGQCANTAPMTIVVNQKVDPTFNQISALCINSVPPPTLATTSLNSKTGTWLPSTINTSSPGSTNYTFTPGVNQCSNSISITIVVAPIPTANATASVITGNPILNVDFTNSSTNATTLNWDFGNGSNSTVNGNASATYSSPGTYTVTLTASNNICPDATWTQIIIVKPIDPLVVIIPNIFTPNNDQINDDYFLDVKNAETFEAAIYNRWGNELISLVHSSDKWNGKLSSGDLADEGTYFVKYKIVGYDKTIKEGITFFHLHLGL